MESQLTSLPPVFAASALYDNLLQAALRQFFSRATFETEPIPSLSSDGRLAIEPTGDPSVLSVRWFGSRHILHVPKRRPFTDHEVRLARAIGAVLAMRYRAIFDPRLFTAANRSLPFGTFLRVSYEGKCAIVLINDRGPYGRLERVIDLSEAAADYLGVGVSWVHAEILVPTSRI